MSNIKVCFEGVDKKGLPIWKVLRDEKPVKPSELTKSEIVEVGAQAKRLRITYNV